MSDEGVFKTAVTNGWWGIECTCPRDGLNAIVSPQCRRHNPCVDPGPGLAEMEVRLATFSDGYDWKPGRQEGAPEAEVFEAGTFRFNVSRAKRIIRASPRPVTLVPVAPYAALLEMLVDLDVKRGRAYNLGFPIIVATLKRGGTILIDGWHRVDRAVKEGIRELPAVFLTVDETKLVRRR